MKVAAPAPTGSLAAVIAAALCWAAVLLWYLVPWAKSPTMPGNDFPGGISYFWCIDTLVKSHGTLPSWNPYWFNGCSNLFVAGQWGSLPFVLPLVRLFGVLRGLKWAVALFMAAGSLTMGLFLARVRFSTAACIFGSGAYAFFPLQLVSGVVSGHVVVSMIYALIPLCFLFLEMHGERAWGSRINGGSASNSIFFPNICSSFLKGVRAGAGPSAAYLGLITALTVSFDLEKGLIIGLSMVLYGFMRSLVTSLEQDHVTFSSLFSEGARDFGVMTVPGVLAICLTAFTLLPLAMRTGEFAIFPPEIIESNRRTFSMPTLLSLFDRFSVIGNNARPEIRGMFENFSGFHYIGLVLFPLLATAVALYFRNLGGHEAEKAVSHEAGTRDFLKINPGPLPFAALFAAALLLSQGPYSVAVRNRSLPGAAWNIAGSLAGGDWVFLTALCISLATGFAAVVAAFFWACVHIGPAGERKIVFSRFFGVILVACILFFLPVFPLLEKVIPLFGKLRSPMWFFNMVAGLSLSAGAAVFFDAFPIRDFGIGVRTILAVSLTAAVLIDASVYGSATGAALKPFQMECIERLHSSLPGGEYDSAPFRLRNFRVLHTGSYSPAEETGVMDSGAGSPWCWLNWMSPKRLHPLFFGLIFPTLESWIGGPVPFGKFSSGNGSGPDDSIPGSLDSEVVQANRSDLAEGYLRLMQVRFITAEKGWIPGHGVAGTGKAPSSLKLEMEVVPPTDLGFGGYHVYSFSDGIPYARMYEAAGIFFGDQGFAPAVSWVCHLKGVALICAPEKSTPETVDPGTLTAFRMVISAGGEGPVSGLRENSGERFYRLPGDGIALDEAPGFSPGFREIKVFRPASDRIEINVGPGRPGILTLSESYHPDWRVFLEGRKIRPMRVQSIFMGVEVGREAAKVVFEHSWPWQIWPGLALSLAGLAFAAFWMVSPSSPVLPRIQSLFKRLSS